MNMAFVIRTDGTSERLWGDDKPTLTQIQEVVGGWIEHVPIIMEGMYMYCNEEGKLKGLPPNWLATNLIDFDDVICGDVVIMEEGDEEE